MSAEVRVIPLEGIPEIEDGDDLAALLLDAVGRAGGFEDADVLVVAQKAVSKAEGSVVRLDDADAKALALDLAGRLVSGRAVDAGPLASARALEGMTAVIVNVNKRYKAHAGLRISGLP
ncbi:MAG TPA: coenzyme F420-0:L-glutamate ligase [Gaiellaceae bacterium]|nr:coenzyme F420-0:L-glutamate ligase [Gaiellaceae bacterium]